MLILIQMGCNRMIFRDDNKNTNTLVAVSLLTDSKPVSHIDVQDINRDRFPDILAGNYIYTNPLHGNDSTWQPIALNPNLSRPFFFNVDDDGLPDIIDIHSQTLSITWIEALDPEGIHWSQTIPTQQTPKTQIEAFPLQGKIDRRTDTRQVYFESNNSVYALNLPEQPEETPWSFVQLERNDTKPYDTLSHVVVADFNQDGIQDKAVYSPTNSQLIITLRNP